MKPAAPNAAALLPGLYNPLQHLVAAAELLDRQRLTPEARACARAILQSGRMILNVVEDLRQMATASLEPVVAAPAVLTELVEDVEALWRLQTAPSAGRLLLSCSAPAGLTLNLDGGGAKQLLNTLIGRALNEVAGGVVEARVALRMGQDDQGSTLRLCVSSSTTPATPAAQDAGLALAGALVFRLGGGLDRALNPGSGETITVELPVEIIDTSAVEADEDQAVLPARTHVLIVDDNATNRMVAGALCEMFGCTTQTAEDGVEAVEAARATRFDLILMDIKMPRMDGIEATRAIRRLPGVLGRVPIVALTANGDADAAKVYLANGMDAVVEKPIKPDSLLETLQRVLEPEAAGERGDARSSAA
ncbi:MAG: response regulator [Pseudomonadota bacterium]|nr:response regulator [Pseudomonadota bacterium]